MTSKNTYARRSGDSGVAGVRGEDRGQAPGGGGRKGRNLWGLALVAAGIVGTSACTRESRPESFTEQHNTATIQVVSGNGRLAGGESYEIAEWRSGILPESGEGYADFRGQDGGPTLDLRLQGPDRVGEFTCGEAGVASLELRVDGTNTYRASADAPCRFVVERRDKGVIEGRYMATLRHTGNASDEMGVQGAFRATNPAAMGEAVRIDAAQGPKLGLR